MKYWVTIVRIGMDVEKEFENDNGKRNMFLNINKPLRHDNFESLSESQRKRFVKGFLNTVSRENLRSEIDLESKERVIVNPQDEYGFDNAVFDEEIKLPKHLVDEESKKVIQ